MRPSQSTRNGGKTMTIRRWVQLRYYDLHRIFPRFKFWRICKALGITPHPWQKAFALGKTKRFPREATRFRATGKTTAVMLRLLMVHPGQSFDILKILRADPDFDTSNRMRLGFYDSTYRRMAWRCYEAHIPIITDHRIYQLHDQYSNRRH